MNINHDNMTDSLNHGICFSFETETEKNKFFPNQRICQKFTNSDNEFADLLLQKSFVPGSCQQMGNNLFGTMRSLTKEEAILEQKYLKSISKFTGKNIHELFH